MTEERIIHWVVEFVFNSILAGLGFWLGWVICGKVRKRRRNEHQRID